MSYRATMTVAVLVFITGVAIAAQADESGAARAPERDQDPADRASERASEQAERSASLQPSRRPVATWREIFAGPFPSSRLFNMPTAEVIGAYQISLSGDASLLSENNVLSTSSVVAIGFGDIAQLEYRSSTAVTTLDETPVRLPSLGVQLEIPYRAPRFVPELAVALRFGIPRSEVSVDGSIEHEEQATDLYLVGRLPLGRLILHGGVRATQAEITSQGPGAPENFESLLFLPAAGLEYQVTEQTLIAAEIARVPLFDPGDSTRPSDIKGGFFGRAGARWRIVPWLVMDASVGYRIEVERLDSSVGGMANALVDWDMRLGGEIFIPWGAVLCRRARMFCE